MKALVWTAAERMEIEERPVPVPGDGEVLIKVEAVGICGSEIEGYLGHNSLRIPPLVMGHEFCGTIVELGSREEAAGLRAGQRVVVNPLLYCGICRSCVRGQTQLCAQRTIIGIHRPGAFAEYTAVPAQAITPISASISPYRAALAEPLACSLRATRRAMQRHTFPNVLVFGAGGIGLLCAKAAKLLGAAKVIVTDTNAERLAISRQTGADVVINPRTEELATVLQEQAGTAGVDVIIDAAGFQATRSAAIELINAGGTIMNIGLGIDGTQLPINMAIRSEIELLGSFCYNREDFKQAVRLLESGVITEQGWTEVRTLDEGGTAFAELVAGKVVNGKIFMHMGKENGSQLVG